MLQPSVMLRTSPAPQADALFEEWISVREHASYDPLSRAAAVPYQYIWKRWCNWLQEPSHRLPGATYLQATSQDVHRFLQHGCSPASARKSRSAPVSPVTRFRYGRVLRELYQHAVNFGYLQTNPVTDAAIGTPPTEVERGGQILPPRVFESLFLTMPADPTPYEKRDNAIMLLLLECALTPGEVRALKMSDVTKNTTAPGQFLLQIDGPRAAQYREISTTGRAGYALFQWMVYRKVMQRKTNVVFVSEKRGQMTRRALFGLVATRINLACQYAKVDLPNHIGPMVIRNHCIVQWFNTGRGVDEICKVCGFKDSKSFMRGLGAHLQRPPAARRQRQS